MLLAYEARVLEGGVKAVKRALESTARIPDLVYEQSARQVDAMSAEDAVRFAVAGALQRTASAVLGASVGLFIAPVPFLCCLTDQSERAALATFCVAILPKALWRVASSALEGHRPRLLAAMPFGVGLFAASAVGGWVVFMTPPEYLRGGLGVLLCSVGGLKAVGGAKAFRAVLRK